MNTETMIRELNAVAEKHKNNFTPTFQTNITAMCRDIIPKLERLAEYEAIGTVEECREAMERQEPMKLYNREAPFIGKRTQIQCHCPQCDIILGVGISENPIIQGEIRHCFNCGQKLYR